MGQEREQYRDRIATIDEEGRRRWIYPKRQRGAFHRARAAVAALLLAFLALAPFLRIGGEQLVLLAVLERKFVLFGTVFWPQDFHLFVLILIASFVFLFLFTAVYGRLFCGWICPQTVFMEMVFRKIEYLVEGGAQQQRALARAPWTPSKLLRKTAKHLVFWSVSFVICNLFLAYLIGSDALARIVREPVAEHAAGFAGMLILTTVFYGTYAFFREQVCTLVCPYGRLQSVLLDENSVVISYDTRRGEPRRRFLRGDAREGAGDCIDCRQCVAVCPTGIDIRNGTQLECVNCALCIDACDEVMARIGKPKRLVRYASASRIATGERRVTTARVAVYTTVLALLAALIGFLLLTRNAVETTVLRAPGTLFQEKPGGVISNLYTVKVINKSRDAMPLELRLLEPRGVVTPVGGAMTLPPGGVAETAVFVDIERARLARVSTPIEIGLFARGRLIDRVGTTFMGPGR